MRGDQGVTKKIHALLPEDIGISAVTAMELVYGAHKRGSKKISEMVHGFIEDVTVLPFDERAAHCAGIIRAQLSLDGIALSFPDSQIAGHAQSLKLTLVTSDNDFKAVSALKIVCWQKK